MAHGRQFWDLSSGPAATMPQSVAPSGPPASIQGGSGRAPQSGDATTINGQANVRLSLAGFPPGTKATGTTEGDLFSHAGPVRIESGMVGLGSAA